MAKSMEELMKNIKKQVQDVAQKEVKKTIKETMQKHIDSDVYDQFQPTQYDRRDINGGLIADENINIEVAPNSNGVNITATNETLGVDDAYNEPIIGIIETGIGYTWSHKPPKRPVMENTAEDLKQNNLIEKALREGLKKKGINTK